jgi:hypothetical protein
MTGTLTPRSMSLLGTTFVDVETVSEQLTTRDAAVFTWAAVGLVAVIWSMLRGGDVGRSVLAVVQSFFAPRILAMFLLVTVWQLVFVYLAALVGLWDSTLLRDTIVIIIIGSLLTGFKALALMKGEETWRGEVRSVITLVVVIQWLSNLGTFPYIVELAFVPVAILLGGMQAVANLNDEHKPIRPLINGTVILLGLGTLVWSVYRVVSSWGSTEWETIGKSFALAFWLPATLLPAIYLAALVMQYGQTISRMKVVRAPTFGARADLCLHHRLNLRRLNAFADTPGRAREYARAQTRADRLEMLRASVD